MKSGIITNKNLNTVLEKPENYIESQKYFSWERFFTQILMLVTKDTYLKYSKKKLNAVYLHEDIRLKILLQITGIEL